MPLQKVEWAEKFVICADRFGVQWMVSHTGDVKFGQGGAAARCGRPGAARATLQERLQQRACPLPRAHAKSQSCERLVGVAALTAVSAMRHRYSLAYVR